MFKIFIIMGSNDRNWDSLSNRKHGMAIRKLKKGKELAAGVSSKSFQSQCFWYLNTRIYRNYTSLHSSSHASSCISSFVFVPNLLTPINNKLFWKHQPQMLFSKEYNFVKDGSDQPIVQGFTIPDMGCVSYQVTDASTVYLIWLLKPMWSSTICSCIHQNFRKEAYHVQEWVIQNLWHQHHVWSWTRSDHRTKTLWSLELQKLKHW